MPRVATGVAVSYLDPAAPWADAIGAGSGPVLQAAAVARVLLRYDDTKAALVHDEEYEAVLAPVTSFPQPSGFVAVDYDDRDLLPTAPPGAVYRLPPSEVATKTWWNELKRSLTDHLVATRRVQILANAELKLYSRVGETTDEFTARCTQVAGERADAAIAALQRKYETKLRTLQSRADTAAGAAARAAATHEAEHGAAAQVTTILGGIFGGRRSRSSIVTQAKRSTASQGRVDAARDKAAAADRAVLDIEAELQDEVAELDRVWTEKAAAIQALDIPLEKADVRVVDLRLVWVPVPSAQPAAHQ